MGANAAARTWYFAEGYTGAGFDQYLTILNPNPAEATVRVTYYLTDGATKVVTLTVPATSRATVTVHDAPQGVGRGQAVAAVVEGLNGLDIVVERPMYFTYGEGITGGHTALGFAP
jgi:hypothetical protein